MSHSTAPHAPTLASEQRRRVVAGVVDDTVATIGDLHPRGRAEEIEAALRETHLPALAEAGYIEWDPETGEITPGPNFAEAAGHVEGLPLPDADLGSADD